jgi:signal peptidase I
MRKKITKAIGWLLAICFFSYAFMCLGVMVVKWAGGYDIYKITSNSMSPAINKGDLVFAKQPNGDLQAGQIVVIQQNDGNIVTHRVISAQNGQILTKGDANDELDTFVNPTVIAVVKLQAHFIGKLMFVFQSTDASLSSKAKGSLEFTAATWGDQSLDTTTTETTTSTTEVEPTTSTEEPTTTTQAVTTTTESTTTTDGSTTSSEETSTTTTTTTTTDNGENPPDTTPVETTTTVSSALP